MLLQASEARVPELQVVTAACVKCGVKPPKDPEDLYEEDRCAVVGSRKMEHSNQLQ